MSLEGVGQEVKQCSPVGSVPSGLGGGAGSGRGERAQARPHGHQHGGPCPGGAVALRELHAMWLRVLLLQPRPETLLGGRRARSEDRREPMESWGEALVGSESPCCRGVDPSRARHLPLSVLPAPKVFACSCHLPLISLVLCVICVLPRLQVSLVSVASQ